LRISASDCCWLPDWLLLLVGAEEDAVCDPEDPWLDCVPPDWLGELLAVEDELPLGDDDVCVELDEDDCDDDEDDEDDEELDEDELDGIDGIEVEDDCCVCIVWQAVSSTATEIAIQPASCRIGFMAVIIPSRLFLIDIFYINAGSCDRLTVFQFWPKAGSPDTGFCMTHQDYVIRRTGFHYFDITRQTGF